jgi:hypothetical protein
MDHTRLALTPDYRHDDLEVCGKVVSSGRGCASGTDGAGTSSAVAVRRSRPYGGGWIFETWIAHHRRLASIDRRKPFTRVRSTIY